MKRCSERSDGFTLVELLVGVALIGILASVALPVYQEHIQRVRRTDAEKSLMELAQYLERFYTSRGSYVGAVLPFTIAPRDGAPVQYRLSFAKAPEDSSYVLQAVPEGAMARDGCGVLTLASSGLRGAAAEHCW
ncbi:type IV pilin protein [Pseudomonas sp. PDNC002]|uniref:type IV pilin protein n=1 Tax=Pseudomonas sp. PDNC002 TaxID=2811422 RepID=UPI001966466F|nr:type IV pilin protein [Pseudomonas sp. PDNC002]QRY79864.1 type IV pilin protein [Pseudomonas sp. PDNC002]